MYFCIKNCIRTKGEVCRQLKIFLNAPVGYATDRSKTGVPALFLILCSFCGLYHGSMDVLKSSVFFVLISLF